MNQRVTTLTAGDCDSSQIGRGGLFYVIEDAGLFYSVKDLITGNCAHDGACGCTDTRECKTAWK